MDLQGWLGSAVAAITQWQDGFGSFETDPSLLVSDERFASVFAEFTGRLRDNYPFFHPSYAGQMLKPPHPAAVAGYLAAMLINPNNHALDGGPATWRAGWTRRPWTRCWPAAGSAPWWRPPGPPAWARSTRCTRCWRSPAATGRGYMWTPPTAGSSRCWPGSRDRPALARPHGGPSPNATRSSSTRTSTACSPTAAARSCSPT